MGENPVADMQDGQTWFEDQDTATQKEIMGETKWQAWMDGKFEFGQLAQDTPNDVYGNMKTVTPLKDLIDE
jgi:hypothetical protein